MDDDISMIGQFDGCNDSFISSESDQCSNILGNPIPVQISDRVYTQHCETNAVKQML